MGTWAAFVAFTQIAETIDGDITAESFYEAANTTSNLDLNGMVPVLDFTQEWTDGLEGYQRLFNRSVVYSTLENGKVVPLTTEFEDVSDLALPPAPQLIRLVQPSTADSPSPDRRYDTARSRRPVPGPAPPSCRACRPG